MDAGGGPLDLTCQSRAQHHAGCRAPIPSKGKQQIGALFCGEQSIELTTAVTWTPLQPKALASPASIPPIHPLSAAQPYLHIDWTPNILLKYVS